MAMAVKITRDLSTVMSCIDLSVRIVTKSPKVEPLLIFSMSLSLTYRHEHESGDPEHEVEEEHGVLHTGGDVRESAGDPSSGSHSSPVQL